MAIHDTIRMSSKDYVKGVPYVKEGINLCRLPNGLACMGCCGFDFAKDLDNKKAFITAMKQSSDEFATFDDREKYKKRVDPKDLHGCGLCKQLIVKEHADKSVEELAKEKHLVFTCPLHPAETGGKELRKGECDPNFMCETQKMWHGDWSEWTRKKFLEFLDEKDLNWFEYSKGMHGNHLVQEFYKQLQDEI
jgi:hypothetical protein